MFDRAKKKSFHYSYLPRAIVSQIIFQTAFFFFLFALASTRQTLAQTIDSSLAGNVHPIAVDDHVKKNAPVIGTIIIAGNKITKEDIILRELTFAVGDTVSEEQIEYCKNRVYSLGLFNKVDMRYAPVDTTVLLITVNERWYIYPVPMVGIVDRDFAKWFYGLGVKHENTFGRSEKLFGGFVLGYNPWAKIDYSDPWILGSLQMFSSIAVSYSRVENKSVVSRREGPNFCETHYNISQTIGKRYDQYHKTWFSLGLTYLEVSDKQIGRTSSPQGIDRYIQAGIGANHDTRDFREYPSAGVYGVIGYTKYGFGESDVDYSSLYLDVRKYTPLVADISFAVRTFTTITFGPNMPNYNHFFFGYGERIRGHFHDKMEGENIFGASAELRFPIIKSWYVTVPDIPIPQFATWRFGLYAAVFADAGRLWNKHQPLTWNNMPSGYGAGLHFLFPYSIVLRFDYALNELGHGEFIFDLGASF